MDKKEFKEVVGEVLVQNGFKFMKRKFCLENDTLLVFIDFQKSNFSNSYYLNYHFVIKELHDSIQKLTVKEKDFGGRMSYSDSCGKSSGDFELDIVQMDNIKDSIQYDIDNHILPAFTKGIIDYLNERPIMKKMSSKATKVYLENKMRPKKCH